MSAMFFVVVVGASLFARTAIAHKNLHSHIVFRIFFFSNGRAFIFVVVVVQVYVLFYVCLFLAV